MNPVILERMRELQKEKESLTCSICCGELTLKNIVNPECGHSTCKDCFWRWAKDKNTCPFCRTSLLKNDQEAKDIQQMRDLLTHRSNIVRQVEESYEEHDELVSTNNILKKKKETVTTYLAILETRRLNYIKKLDYLRRANSGTYKTYRYFQEEQRKERELYRIHRPFWRSCRQLHNYLFKKICKDINSLGRRMKNIYIMENKEKRITRSMIMLTKIYRMNKIRKERDDFRFVRDNNAGLALNLLEKMFTEPYIHPMISEEEYDILNETVWNWQLLSDYNNEFPWPTPQPPSIFHTDNLINNYQGDIEEIN
jgi:hypothetical protein